MSKTTAEVVAFLGTLWFLWVVQTAYLLRHRYSPARAVVNFVKILYRKPDYPDTLVRDWLILMYVIAGFLATLIGFSYFAQQ